MQKYHILVFGESRCDYALWQRRPVIHYNAQPQIIIRPQLQEAAEWLHYVCEVPDEKRLLLSAH